MTARHLPLFLLSAVLLTVQPALSAPRATAPANAPRASTPAQKEGPGLARNVETRITASKLTYSADKQQAVFEGQVHVVRPDLELWTDRLVAHMKPSAKKNDGDKPKSNVPEGMAGGDLDKLEAIGSVRMASEPNRTGSCAKAVYTASDGVLRMEGNPVVSDGENTVTGEVIRYFTRENRSEVQGGKKRVEAVFSSQQKGGGR